MGVAMNWIKEKLSTSNSLLRTNGRLLGSHTRQFSNSRNPIARIGRSVSPPKESILAPLLKKGQSGKRNEDAMLEGAHSQEIYRAGNVAVLSSHLRLGACSYDPAPKAVPGPAPTFLPERLEAETIAGAATGLEKGQAILIEVEHKRTKEHQADDGAHAIAFYKSSGETLYFFDPNAGVYRIPNAGETAWPPRDNVDVARSLPVPGQNPADGLQQQAQPAAPETNALRFIKRWMDIYDNAEGIRWKTPDKNWCHTYDHILPKGDTKA
jgi:hypothetical protein